MLDEDTVVTKTTTRYFSKQQLRNYWQLLQVRETIWQQTRHRHVAWQFVHELGQPPVMRRHLTEAELQKLDRRGFDRPVWDEGKPFWELLRDDGDADDPQDWAYITNHGLIEVIPEVHDNRVLDALDYVVVDLDPKGDFEFSYVKDVARRAFTVMEEVLPHRYREIRFSGNRSFHLCFWLPQPMEFERVRMRVKGALQDALEPITWLDVQKKRASKEDLGDISLTNTRAREQFIFIDCGAMARHRCVRALGSLHWKTGRVCVRVGELLNLALFDPRMATIEMVAKYPGLVEYRDGN